VSFLAVWQLEILKWQVNCLSDKAAADKADCFSFSVVSIPLNLTSVLLSSPVVNWLCRAILFVGLLSLGLSLFQQRDVDTAVQSLCREAIPNKSTRPDAIVRAKQPMLNN
jgi:hypothetical protein